MNIDLYKTFLYNYKYFIDDIPIQNDIPNLVTHLTFGYLFNQPLEKDDIPNTVTHLTFGYMFNQLLNKDDIPKKAICHLNVADLMDFFSNTKN